MPPTHREVVAKYSKPASEAKLKKLNKTRLNRALASAEKKAGSGKNRQAKLDVSKALAEFDDAEKKRLAVQAYRKYGTIARAARVIDVPRSAIERWIIEDPIFREEMINAHEGVIDDLEEAAIKRAKGTKEQAGSDDLLKFLLRANREKFAATSGGGAATPAQRRQQEEEQRAAAQKQKFKVAGQEIEF